MQIHKASGFSEDFHPEKLQRFLRKIGLPEDFQTALLTELENFALSQQKDMSVHELRHWVSDALLRLPQGQMWKARFLLKEAVYRLGPEGHHFEQFVGRIFASEGYQVEVGVVKKGKCVTHEVDVWAVRDAHHNYVECKFHNKEGIRSDIVTALYSHARFRDLHNGNHSSDVRTESGWLATNTKLTDQALDYARCVNMQVLSLTLPENNSILHRVFKQKLYPVTCLDTLSESTQSMLLADGVILASEFLSISPETAQRLQISDDSLIAARAQAEAILQ